ncbi:MAG: OstA-like protein [Ferruginibacter sp.]
MRLHKFNRIFFSIIFLLAARPVFAQIQSSQMDTTKIIQIIRANSFRQKKIDSVTTLVMLAGDAVVKQGTTILSGDSIVLDQRTGVAEVFGNVHINDADTVHTYSQYLKYIGNEKMAFLKKNVKLTDGHAVLTTNELEYNLQTGIATYSKGGKVINGKTVLTSEDAVYYSDTRDVFFKNNVHLVDEKSDMVADSLRYNTLFKEAYFIAPTRIKTQDGIILTRSGTYKVETGEAVFYDRTSYSDSIRSVTGGKMAYDKNSGILQVEDNAKLVDSVNKVTVIGGLILLNRNTSSFLATRKPVMILYRNNDSTYIAADTLFSGLRKYDSSQQKIITVTDTLKKAMAFNVSTVTDSMGKPASLNKMPVNNNSSLADSIKKINEMDSLTVKDSLKNKIALLNNIAVNNNSSLADSIKKITATDSIPVKGSLTKTAAERSPAQDSIRYFLAFHHVRIYNDSLQAVSDSLHYSTADSTFKLFGDPVFWNDKTQVNGDTMYLFTANQKAKRLFVFNTGIVINKTKEGFYNQIGGRTLNAYFKEGVIDYIRVKGTPAESIYYPQDEDSAYIGMNRSSGDVIDMYFIKKELNKVKFVNDVNGTLYPLKQIPADRKFLKKFKWMDDRRPKNKLELFE